MQVDATAESIWNRRVEGLVDQRQTDDQAVVDDALTKRLEEGATPTTTAFQVSPTGGLEYGTDFFLGDVVGVEDRKSTRLNSSHVKISYAVFCLKKKITS